jgi:hypothetical protein
MTSDHLFFIPGVLLIGVTLGYALGTRAARSALERAKRRAKE